MLSVLAGYSGPIKTYYGDEWGAYVKGYDGAGSLGAYNDNMARSNGKISGFTLNRRNSGQNDFLKFLLTPASVCSRFPVPLNNGEHTDTRLLFAA